MNDQSLHWQIEEACSNAWPPLNQAIIGGWQLRFSNGFTRRINSANPLHGCVDHSQRIMITAENLYAKHNLPAIFRIPSIMDDASNKYLEQNGYKAEGQSNILFCSLDEFKIAQNGHNIEITSKPSQEWLAAHFAFKKLNDKDTATYKNVVGEITVPAAYLALRHEGHIASMAFGAVTGKLLSVESVFTHANYRGRYFAKYVLSAMADWAAQNGADSVCLQVEADNRPATSLYRNMGLREVYRYHYLRKPL